MVISMMGISWMGIYCGLASHVVQGSLSAMIVHSELEKNSACASDEVPRLGTELVS